MKKAACILLSILLLMGCTGCAAVISHPSGTAVRICYDREDVSFDLELSQEEANVVLSALNGKRRELGYDRNWSRLRFWTGTIVYH